MCVYIYIYIYIYKIGDETSLGSSARAHACALPPHPLPPPLPRSAQSRSALSPHCPLLPPSLPTFGPATDAVPSPNKWRARMQVVIPLDPSGRFAKAGRPLKCTSTYLSPRRNRTIGAGRATRAAEPRI